MRKFIKIIKGLLIFLGALFVISTIWMAAGRPLIIDRLLIKSDTPHEAIYIICLTGGITPEYLPTDEGWRRIYSAVQLYLDGFAPKIIFSGGGVGKITEAEVYAEAAGWLGCPSSAIWIEPRASSTAEHPFFLLQCGLSNLTKETKINIVTTPLHSRRAAAVFRKAGFTNYRIVTGYSSRKVNDPAVVRSLRTSRFNEYTPSKKSYDNVLSRLQYGIETLFSSLWEGSALFYYLIKGKI